MGVLDGREGFDMPMMASTIVMRHSLAISMRLWAMLEGERQKISRQALGSG